MNDLDRWAREFGYQDFDTFLQTGGSVADASRDIQKRIKALQNALAELGPALQWIRQPENAKPISHTIGLEDMKASIADAAEDEPVDSENAHVQGDDHLVG